MATAGVQRLPNNTRMILLKEVTIIDFIEFKRGNIMRPREG